MNDKLIRCERDEETHVKCLQLMGILRESLYFFSAGSDNMVTLD